MENIISENGITVKELKEFVKDLPVGDKDDVYEVWVEHTDNERMSSIARSVMRLNKGDIIISINDE